MTQVKKHTCCIQYVSLIFAYSLVDVNGDIDFMLIWQYPLHTMHILLHFEPVSTWNHRPQKAVQ